MKVLLKKNECLNKSFLKKKEKDFFSNDVIHLGNTIMNGSQKNMNVDLIL